MKTIDIKEKDGRITQYVRDTNGVIKQLYPEKFTYDKTYIATYDTAEYARKAEALQAIRLGFVLAMANAKIESLIDIGYGNGAFLTHVHKHTDIALYGFDVSGVPLPSNVLAGFDNEWYINSYDVMTFWDCLEHFPDISFIKNIQAKMIVVSLPWCKVNQHSANYGEGNAAAAFADWHHRKPNEHLHHFDRQSLLTTFLQYGWVCHGTTCMEDAIRKRYHQNILTAAFTRSV